MKPRARPPQELREGKKDGAVEASLVDESNLLHWKGKIMGPVGTPYENGIFKIDIQLPSDYPFVPPKERTASPPLRLSPSTRTRTERSRSHAHAHAHMRTRARTHKLTCARQRACVREASRHLGLSLYTDEV